MPVREAAGEEVSQVVVGSSANPGLRDFAIVAEVVKGHQSDDRVSLDINPTSRQTLEDLAKGGWLFDLIAAGARVHQASGALPRGLTVGRGSDQAPGGHRGQQRVPLGGDAHQADQVLRRRGLRPSTPGMRRSMSTTAGRPRSTASTPAGSLCGRSTRF